MPTTQAAQGLGRVFDVVPVASGNMFSMKNANAVSFIVESSGAAALAVVAAKTYGGSTTTWTTGNGFGQTAFFYQQAAVNGTAAWTKQTAVWTSNSVALAATTTYGSVITIYATQFADGYDYIQVTGTNTTYVVAVLHDLSVARTPANLVKLGA
jgi:hypothetical protein